MERKLLWNFSGLARLFRTCQPAADNLCAAFCECCPAANQVLAKGREEAAL